MTNIGFRLLEEFDIFQGSRNPKGAGMPERWFVVYGPPISATVSLRLPD